MNPNRKSILLTLRLLSLLKGNDPYKMDIDFKPPLVEIVSWSRKLQTVTLKATGDIDLSDFVLRKEGTRTIRSLKGVKLKANVETTLKLRSNFFSQKENAFVLAYLSVVDHGEDF